jgi:hypothetical protein
MTPSLIDAAPPPLSARRALLDDQCKHRSLPAGCSCATEFGRRSAACCICRRSQENIRRFRLVSDRKVPRKTEATTFEFESAHSMPVTYQIDKTKRIIHTRCIGKVTIKDVIDHFRVLARDPNCPAHVDVLLDLSEQTSIPTNENLRDVTREIGRIRNGVQFGTCAIVACSDALFGMLRMFEVFIEEYFRESHVFRTTSEAEAWLVLHSTSSATG